MQKSNLLNFISIIFLIFSFTFYQSLFADEEGVVIKVIDGDTIHLLTDKKDKIKVRLQFIDAPELKQPYGYQSKQILESIILNKRIFLKSHSKDRYKRILGVIFLHKEDINLKLIKMGAAWHYKKYTADQPIDNFKAYSTSEFVARSNKRGLWSKNATAPWDWRKKNYFTDKPKGSLNQL